MVWICFAAAHALHEWFRNGSWVVQGWFVTGSPVVRGWVAAGPSPFQTATAVVGMVHERFRNRPVVARRLAWRARTWPEWFRNGSLVVHEWFRNGSDVVPYWFVCCPPLLQVAMIVS